MKINMPVAGVLRHRSVAAFSDRRSVRPRGRAEHVAPSDPRCQGAQQGILQQIMQSQGGQVKRAVRSGDVWGGVVLNCSESTPDRAHPAAV